jgi:predicted transcriptional regulator
VESGLRYIGKESHRHEEADQRTVHDLDGVTVNYGSDEWNRLKSELNDYPVPELARAAGVSDRSIQYYRAGEMEPRSAVKRRLLSFLRRGRS